MDAKVARRIEELPQAAPQPEAIPPGNPGSAEWATDRARALASAMQLHEMDQARIAELNAALRAWHGWYNELMDQEWRLPVPPDAALTPTSGPAEEVHRNQAITWCESEASALGNPPMWEWQEIVQKWLRGRVAQMRAEP